MRFSGYLYVAAAACFTMSMVGNWINDKPWLAVINLFTVAMFTVAAVFTFKAGRTYRRIEDGDRARR